MPSTSSPASIVDDAITSRRSVRKFLPRPVEVSQIEQILDVAARAPSGHNTQPWHVHLVMGEALSSLSKALMDAFAQPDAMKLHVAEFDSYPSRWQSPYLERRRKVGGDMYGLLAIPRGDTAAMQAQAGENFTFFGAPVGLFFTVERVMMPGSALDVGMFIQNVMTAARARELDTCAQAALAMFHRIVSPQLGIPPEHMLVCGMSLGWADQEAPINRLVTERVPVRGFATMHV